MILRVLFSFIIGLFLYSCNEKDDNSALDSDGLINTMAQSSLGLDEDSMSDYFYNFDSSIDATFLNYRQDGLINTILYPELINPDSDTINFRTFPDFLLKVDAIPLDIEQNIIVQPFDETQGGNCVNINDNCLDINGDGSLTNVSEVLDISQNDTLTIYSHQFTSIDNLTWSQDDNRYKTNLKTDFPHFEDPEDPESDVTYSQWEYDVATIPIEPIYAYDSLIYMTKIDTNITTADGVFYIDESEFIKTDSIYSQNQIAVQATFEFHNMNSLSSDSIMFHKITDCDYDGEWDPAEEIIADYNNNGIPDVYMEWTDGYSADGNSCPEDGLWTGPSPGCPDGEPCHDFNGDGEASCKFIYEWVDRADGILTDVEPFWDINGNGYREQNEPFEDRNCNGLLDNSARTLSGYTSESDHTEDQCTQRSGSWLGDFCDFGNGKWDGDEIFIDKNGDELWDSDESLTQLMGSPSRFIFDYSNQADPVELNILNAQTGDIELKAFGSNQTGTIINAPLQSNTIEDAVTQYIPEIDKVVTIFSNEIIAQMDQDLDSDYHITKLKTGYIHPTLGLIEEHTYNIFNDENHITLLNYPTYFIPYGYYWTPQQIDDGFWRELALKEDVMLYTSNGLIREGEHIQLDTLLVTIHGNYNIEVDYIVEKDNEVSVPAFDAPLQETYKITKTLIMTYIGSGVEYGERTTTWIGKDSEGPLGIVKDKVEIRWTEPSWVCPFQDNQPNPDCYDWTDFSRWELLELRRESSSASGEFNFLSRMLNTQRVNIENFKDIEELDSHPFEPKRTAGMHPVRLIDNR